MSTTNTLAQPIEFNEHATLDNEPVPTSQADIRKLQCHENLYSINIPLRAIERLGYAAHDNIKVIVRGSELILSRVELS